MGLLRLVVFGFLALSVLYLALSVYFSSLIRERLEKEWRAENPGSQDEAAHDAYVEAGIKAYNTGIRPKLILLVYVIPMLLVIAALVIINTN
jgi:hypothetical protein